MTDKYVSPTGRLCDRNVSAGVSAGTVKWGPLVEHEGSSHGIRTRNIYMVDIEARNFKISDFPCGHTVALVIRLRKQPRIYKSKVFTLETYR